MNICKNKISDVNFIVFIIISICFLFGNLLWYKLNTPVIIQGIYCHSHAIPKIFELTCKLAKEYNINYVRTQYEKTYFVPKIKKFLTIKYPINIIKVFLLNIFTLKNKNLIKKYALMTNDFIIGVSYTGMMDIDTIEYGLKNLRKDSIVVEALIHPCLYDNNIFNQHYIEFLIMKDKSLKQKIKKMGFNLVNYK